MKCNLNYSSHPSDSCIANNIIKICADSNYPESVSVVLVKLFHYMMGKKLCGCCHAFSSVLFVAFSELGLLPQLYIGECQKNGMKPFDHSWITIDGKIIDIAVYYPLTQIINSVSGPVIFDIDAANRRKVQTQYGINTGLAMSEMTMLVMNTPVDVYMNNFPFEKDGLWEVLKKIYPMDIEITPDLKNKYHDVQRIFVR